jgi:hypothetical protein
MATAQLSPRHRELLALFETHFETERVNDVEACLETLHPEIVYEHPFRPGDDFFLTGIPAVRAYYIRHWGEQPFQSITVKRSWLSGDDSLWCEVQVTVGRPGEAPRRAMTYAMGAIQGRLAAARDHDERSVRAGTLNGRSVHSAAFTHHIGFYPGSAIAPFAFTFTFKGRSLGV